MMIAGSSAAVSAGAKSSAALSISPARSSAPGPPSVESTTESSGSRSRSSATLAAPPASVISAFAPLSDRR